MELTSVLCIIDILGPVRPMYIMPMGLALGNQRGPVNVVNVGTLMTNIVTNKCDIFSQKITYFNS